MRMNEELVVSGGVKKVRVNDRDCAGSGRSRHPLFEGVEGYDFRTFLLRIS